ncbi:TetR family transcriptional regulator [Streptomyces sp. NPDC126514]|uniref:TetR/AcrR family transcriptional regulator n=1 Tax=Streptomyces sp. NPDC126514 TaxID=3155210 RepID=UPI00332FAC75
MSGGSGKADPTDVPSARRSRPKRARSGRRPGDSGTRDQILEAALHLFADRGYARTTIRAIAEAAQVDPALVHHFFVNKEGVFDAAVNSSFSVSATFDETPIGDSSTSQAAWLAHAYFSFWENEKTRYAMTAVYRAGMADSATSDVLRARVEASSKSWASASGYRGLPDAETRTALAAGHLAGLAIMRYVLQIQPLASMEYTEFMAWVVPALEQRLSPQLEPRKVPKAETD